MLGVSTLPELLAVTGYAGVPQHISCWLCFAHNKLFTGHAFGCQGL